MREAIPGVSSARDSRLGTRWSCVRVARGGAGLQSMPARVSQSREGRHPLSTAIYGVRTLPRRGDSGCSNEGGHVFFCSLPNKPNKPIAQGWLVPWWGQFLVVGVHYGMLIACVRLLQSPHERGARSGPLAGSDPDRTLRKCYREARFEPQLTFTIRSNFLLHSCTRPHGKRP